MLTVDDGKAILKKAAQYGDEGYKDRKVAERMALDHFIREHYEHLGSVYDQAGVKRPDSLTLPRLPAIHRGGNTPERLTRVAHDNAKGTPTEKAKTGEIINDFAQRLHAAAPEAFENMEVHAMGDAEWKADKALAANTPDSAAAYDQHSNTLYLNRDKLNPENLASAIVHEGFHFAEIIVGENFVQGEWEKLQDGQREGAAKAYDAKSTKTGAKLKNDKRARSEWFAMQGARVYRGDTKGMSQRLIDAFRKLHEMIRSVVKKWRGDIAHTTEALDKKIIEMLGYDKEWPGNKADAPPPEPNPSPGTLPEGWKPKDVQELLDRVNKGEKILVGDTRLGIPTIHDVAGKHQGEGQFTAETPEYAISHAGGNAMERTTNGQVFTKAKEDRGTFPYDFDAVKTKLAAYLPADEVPGHQMSQHDYMSREAIKKTGSNRVLDALDQDKHQALVENALKTGTMTQAQARQMGHFKTYPDLEKNKMSKEMEDLAKDLFGAPSEGEKVEKFDKKIDVAMREKLNRFVGLLVQDLPHIRNRQALAEFITEKAPNAKPYSESLFRVLSGFTDMEEGGSFAEIYKGLDKAAEPVATETPKRENTPPEAKPAAAVAAPEAKPAKPSTAAGEATTLTDATRADMRALRGIEKRTPPKPLNTYEKLKAIQAQRAAKTAAREQLAPTKDFKDTKAELLSAIDKAMPKAAKLEDFREQAINEAVKSKDYPRKPDEQQKFIADIQRKLAAEKFGKVTIKSGNSTFQVFNNTEALERLRKSVESQARVGKPTDPTPSDRRPNQASAISGYKRATDEAMKRGFIDMMDNATLQKLGLDKEYVRTGRGVVLTKEAADELVRLKAGGKPSDKLITGTPAEPSPRSASTKRAEAVKLVERNIQEEKESRAAKITVEAVTGDDLDGTRFGEGELYRVWSPNAERTWSVMKSGNKWAVESDGSGVGQYATKEAAIDVAKKEIADETKENKGSFGIDLDASHAVQDIFDHFDVPEGVTQSGWFRTKWGSYYNDITLADGATWKLSVRDHEAGNGPMGRANISYEVPKDWNPSSVAKGLDFIESKLAERARDHPAPEEDASPSETAPSPEQQRLAKLADTARAQLAKIQAAGQPTAHIEALLKKIEERLGPQGEPDAPLGTPAESAKDYLDKVKSSLADMKEHLQETGRTVKAFGKDIYAVKKYEGFNKVLNTWVGNNQIGIGHTETAALKVAKEIPSERVREAASVYMDAGGNATKLTDWASKSKGRDKAIYEAALKLTPEQLSTVAKAQRWFDDMHALGVKYGVLHENVVEDGVVKSGGFVEDYVPHMVKLPFVAGGGAAFGGKIIAKFKHSKERTFPNFFDLEQAGFKMKTKDLAQIMAIYGTQLTKAIETRKLAKALLTQKPPEGLPIGKLILGQFKEGETNKANYISDPPAAQEGGVVYKPIPNAAFRGWDYTGTGPDGKPIIMQGEIGIHPDHYAQLMNAIERSKIRAWIDSPGSPAANLAKVGVKAFDQSLSTMKGTMLGGIASFHAIHEIKLAAGYRVVINPVILKQPIDWKDPRTQEFVRWGLMLGGDHDAENHFSEGLGSKSLVDKIPAVGIVSRAFSEYTFHRLIPNLKFHTMDAVFERNMKIFDSDIKSGKVTRDDIGYLSAYQINERFGHQNLADLNRNPTFQHVLGWFTLAPDFWESNIRSYAIGAKGFLGSKTGRQPMYALAFTALAVAAIAQIMNKLFDDQYHFDEPFGFEHKNRLWTMRNPAEDVWRMIHNPRQYFMGRLSPAFGSLIQLGTGKNWRGENVGAMDTLADFLLKGIPISARWLPGIRELIDMTTTGGARTVSRFEEFASSQGFQVSRHTAATQAYKLANDYKKSAGEKDDTGTYPVGKYQQLHYALQDGDMKRAKAEAEKMLATVQVHSGYASQFDRDVALQKLQSGLNDSLFRSWTKNAEMDQAFAKSLKPADRAILRKAEQDREDDANKFAKLFNLKPKEHKAHDALMETLK
jgi:hypothetical protein